MKHLLCASALLITLLNLPYCNESSGNFIDAFVDLPDASRRRILSSTIFLMDRHHLPWAISTKSFRIPLIDQQGLALYLPDQKLLEHSSQASSTITTRNLEKRVLNFLRPLQWKEKVVMKQWLPQKSDSSAENLTRCQNFLKHFEHLSKLHNIIEVFELPGFWQSIQLSSSKNTVRGVNAADFNFLKELLAQSERKKSFLNWALAKWNQKPFIEVRSDLVKLAEAFQDYSLQFPAKSASFEQAQKHIKAHYKFIKQQFLNYGMKEPAAETSLYSDYVELDFFTNISESDYQYLGSNPQEIEIALNNRRRSSEVILDRVYKLAERLNHSAQWIKKSQFVIEQVFNTAKFLELGKLAFTMQQTKAEESLKKLNLNTILSLLSDYGPLHQLGDSDFRFAQEQVAGLADTWLKILITEFEYLFEVRQHEDRIHEQIQTLQNTHLVDIGSFEEIPELKERIRQIHEFNIDKISRSDANSEQRSKNLQSFFDFAQRRMEGLESDVNFLHKISANSIQLKTRLDNLLSDSDQKGLNEFIERDEYIKQKIDLAKSFSVRSMAYVLNGYNPKERDEVVAMHTRVHQDNLGSLEQAVGLLDQRKKYAEEAQVQLKQLLLTARLQNTTIADGTTLRTLREYIEMKDFSPITYTIDPDPQALQNAHQQILTKIAQLGEALLNQK